MKNPVLYLMLGYPGAGKTTVAQQIADRADAVHLWSDLERHKMFDEPKHDEEESRNLYEDLNKRTDKLLSEGKSVVFDTSFNHRSDRNLLREIAARHDADAIIIWLDTPLEMARERAVHAQIVRNGYDFNMTPDQFERIAGHLETPDSDENFIKIDGANFDPDSLDKLIR